MTQKFGWVVPIALIATLGWSTAFAQDVQTKRVMRQKLAESHELLTALVTSNWASLDRHGRALQALTKDPGWAVLRSPEYLRATEAFQGALSKVIDSAGMRDQDTALAAYNSLIASCVQCHRQVARSRIVR